jgi:hypothetical protein
MHVNIAKGKNLQVYFDNLKIRLLFQQSSINIKKVNAKIGSYFVVYL